MSLSDASSVAPPINAVVFQPADDNPSVNNPPIPEVVELAQGLSGASISPSQRPRPTNRRRLMNGDESHDNVSRNLSLNGLGAPEGNNVEPSSNNVSSSMVVAPRQPPSSNASVAFSEASSEAPPIDPILELSKFANPCQLRLGNKNGRIIAKLRIGRDIYAKLKIIKNARNHSYPFAVKNWPCEVTLHAVYTNHGILLPSVYVEAQPEGEREEYVDSSIFPIESRYRDVVSSLRRRLVTVSTIFEGRKTNCAVVGSDQIKHAVFGQVTTGKIVNKTFGRTYAVKAWKENDGGEGLFQFALDKDLIPNPQRFLPSNFTPQHTKNKDGSRNKPNVAQLAVMNRKWRVQMKKAETYYAGALVFVGGHIPLMVGKYDVISNILAFVGAGPVRIGTELEDGEVEYDARQTDEEWEGKSAEHYFRWSRWTSNEGAGEAAGVAATGVIGA